MNNNEMIKTIDEMLEAARLRVYSAYHEGFKFLEDAYELALQNKYAKGVAWATLRFGSYALSRGSRTEAIDFYKEALNLMKETEDLQGVSRCHYSMATVYALMSHYDIALIHFLEAMSLSEKYDPKYHTKLLNNISNAYTELMQYDKAIEICKNILNYMESHNENRLFMPYVSMGEIYLAQKKYQEALKYAELSLQCLENYPEKSYKAFTNLIIAGAYKGLEHYDEALIIYNRVLKLTEEAHDYQNTSKINRELAEIYLIKREYNYAFKHCQLAMTMATKHASDLDESETYFLYANLYEALENYKKSFDCYRKGSKIEQKIRTVQVEERYKAYRLEYDEPLKKPEVESEMREEFPSLNRALSELKETYLDLNKTEKSQLTDAFVEAIVDTIDLRDTTTAGHSKRIARYSLEMMTRMNEDVLTYPYTHFDEKDMKEMYYSALLHDIGKLAISEAVLLKKRRLTEDRMEAIQYKFLYMKACLEVKIENETITPNEHQIYKRIDDDLEFIQSLIFAYSVDDDTIKKVKLIHEYELFDCYEKKVALINEFEFKHLTVNRGNLVDLEWEKMKLHATMTESFLKEIPWLSDLENVPTLASSHHEKLDGSGYPNGLEGDAVTMKMRILAIVDIFEALTASDRPYKPSMTISNALDILKEEAKDGKLDLALIDFFETHGICYLCIEELENLK